MKKPSTEALGPVLQFITVQIEVSGLPALPNTTKGLHWSKLAKIKKEWTERVYYAAKEVKQKENLKGLYDHANIHYHISVGSKRKIDPDNLNFAITKPANDGLTGVFIKDDDIDSISLSYSYDRGPKGFVITLTGL